MLSRFVHVNRQVCRKLQRRFPSLFRETTYGERLRLLLAEQLPGAREVLEIGGGERPTLARGREFHLVGLDLRRPEACTDLYDAFLEQSVEAPIPGQFDLILSVTVLEHVRDNLQAARQIYDALKPGGQTIHYVPSKYHPYALVLRCISPKLQRQLIRHLRPDAVSATGYPAYFDHCSPRQLSRMLSSVGFSEVNATPCFQAGDYFAWFVPGYLLVRAFELSARRLNLQECASGFIITAKRPG